jgi:tetratricopeptide (TPR) repeat protein
MSKNKKRNYSNIIDQNNDEDDNSNNKKFLSMKNYFKKIISESNEKIFNQCYEFFKANIFSITDYYLFLNEVYELIISSENCSIYFRSFSIILDFCYSNYKLALLSHLDLEIDKYPNNYQIRCIKILLEILIYQNYDEKIDLSRLIININNCIDNNPNIALLFYLRCLINFHIDKNHSKILDDINKSLDINPKDSLFYFVKLKQECIVNNNSHDKLLDCLNKMNDNDYVINYSKAIFYINRKEFSKANEELFLSKKKYSYYPDLYYYFGVIAYHSKKWDSAIDNFNMALTLNTNLNEIRRRKYLYYRGCSYFNLKSFEMAKEDFSRLLSNDPENSSYKEKFFECKLKLGIFDDSIKDIEAEVNKKPNDLLLLYNFIIYKMYTILKTKVMDDSILNYIDRAISIKNNLKICYIHKACYLLWKKNYELAFKEIVKANQLSSITKLKLNSSLNICNSNEFIPIENNQSNESLFFSEFYLKLGLYKESIELFGMLQSKGGSKCSLQTLIDCSYKKYISANMLNYQMIFNSIKNDINEIFSCMNQVDYNIYKIDISDCEFLKKLDKQLYFNSNKNIIIGAICDNIKSSKNSIKYVDFSKNRLNDSHVISILDMIESNPNIIKVKFEQTNISETAKKLINNSLSRNINIQKPIRNGYLQLLSVLSKL